MKKIIILIFFIIIVAYGYYDAGVGKYHKGIFRMAYSTISIENNNSIDVAKKFAKTNADVIFVSDWTGANLDPIEILSSGYKVVNDSEKKGPHGVLLFAKNNINITSMVVKSPISGPCAMPILTASLQYNNTLITILGVHAPPPIKRCKNRTDKTVKYFANLIHKSRLARNFGVGKRGDAVIMVGNLNSLPISNTVVEIEHSGLVDAYKEAGSFMGSTWAPYDWLPKLVRIDYVFSSPKLNIQKLWNSRMPGSGHSLLVADFGLSK